MGVQAGGRAEGHAGPAAQQDVDSREARRAEDDEQEPTLGETAVMGCKLGGLALELLEAAAGVPSLMGPNPSSVVPRTSAEATVSVSQACLWAWFGAHA